MIVVAVSGKGAPTLSDKMAFVQEKCDESLYWIELLIRTGQSDSSVVEP